MGELLHKLFEELAALAESAFAVVQRGFVGPVLDLDAHGAVVPGIGEGGEELAPDNVTQAGQLRLVPAQAVHAHLIQPIAVNAFVLRMNVNDAGAELADGPAAID